MLHRPFHDTSTRSADTLFSRARARAAGKLLHASEFMRSPVGPIFQSAVPRALSPGARPPQSSPADLFTPGAQSRKEHFPTSHRGDNGGYLPRDIYSQLPLRFTGSRRCRATYNDNSLDEKIGRSSTPPMLVVS